jgi:hypothetical protein
MLDEEMLSDIAGERAVHVRGRPAKSERKKQDLKVAMKLPRSRI